MHADRPMGTSPMLALAKRLGAATLGLTAVCACSLPAQDEVRWDEQSAGEAAVFQEAPSNLIRAIGATLEARGEHDSSLAEASERAALGALAEGEAAVISSRSVDVDAETLRRWVSEDQRDLVSAEGGRYVLDIRVESAADGSGSEITVSATLVATVPGSLGPIGGRPLTSAGTLEAEFLSELRHRLA